MLFMNFSIFNYKQPLIKKQGENISRTFKNTNVNIGGINGHLPTVFFFKKAFIKLKLILQRFFKEVNHSYQQ